MSFGKVRKTLVACTILIAPVYAVKASSQTDWFCEARNWTRTSVVANYSRNKNDREDNFRLKVVSNSEIRITGSDFWKNGNRRVRKSGSKYIFLDRAPIQGNFGPISPIGQAYFDSSDGTIRAESNGPYIMGMTMFYLWEGTCE